jgi:hypothetical protein
MSALSGRRGPGGGAAGSGGANGVGGADGTGRWAVNGGDAGTMVGMLGSAGQAGGGAGDRGGMGGAAGGMECCPGSWLGILGRCCMGGAERVAVLCRGPRPAGGMGWRVPLPSGRGTGRGLAGKRLSASGPGGFGFARGQFPDGSGRLGGGCGGRDTVAGGGGCGAAGGGMRRGGAAGWR